MRLDAAVRHFSETPRVLVHEMAKFGAVGALNYVIDVGFFNLLVLGPLPHEPLAAKAISTGVSVTTSYVMNRRWTFAHRASTGLAREYAIFAVLSVIGVAITLGCLGFSEYVLHEHSLLARNISGNVVGVGLAMIFRFWSFKRWVFRAPEVQEPSAALT